MDCLLHIAAAICLISPSQLTLRADVSTQIAGDFHYTWAGKDYGGGRLGRIALDVPLVSYRGFTLGATVEHSSLLDTGRDRGQERASIGLTWRPFGGAR